MVSSVLGILKILGALSLFIYGMKVMSESIQRLTGPRLRSALSFFAKNKLAGFLTGFTSTGLIQSSSVTTVMIVSLVHAGLFTVKQSIPIILGANVGTTITAIFVTMIGFNGFQLNNFILPIIAISLPFLFSSKSNFRFFSEFFIGFALLFLGLELMQGLMPDINDFPKLEEMLASINELGFASQILFVVVGIVLTAALQSSSVSIAFVLTLTAKGLIGFENAAAVVLGANVGTTLTANIAAFVANANGKTAARSHLVFNALGLIWAIAIFGLFTSLVDTLTVQLTDISPLNDVNNTPEYRNAANWGLTIFHVLFNTINALLFIGFTDFIERISKALVRSKKVERYHLEYIHNGLMGSPELSILEAAKELNRMSKLIVRTIKLFKELMVVRDPRDAAKSISQINKYHEITQRIDGEIAEYLFQISQDKLSASSNQRIRSMLEIVHALKSVSNSFYVLTDEVRRKIDQRIWFSPQQRNTVLDLLGKVELGFHHVPKILEGDLLKVDTHAIDEIVATVNLKKTSLKEELLQSIEDGESGVLNGLIYSDIITNLEKSVDALNQISAALPKTNA